MSKYKNSEIVKDEEGKQYHIGLKPDEIADKIILVGDPDRAKRTADLFDSVTLSRQNREYITYTGVYQGLDVSVMSTGIGSDNTEIAVVELCQLRFPLTIIRCGTCGALQEDINIEDLIITSGALRLENCSTFFVENGFPAIASHEACLALLKSAEDQKAKYHLGITATAPGFYGAQARHIPGFPIKDEGLIDRLKAQGVKNLEMECSALLTLAALRGFRAGAVCVAFASRTKNEFITPEKKEGAELKAIKTSLGALKNIEQMDKQKGNSAFWIPEI